ncbi:MAG: UDP-N-acetylglucosamine--N-acetylmuramyl-(pentapeptide) pyrophosphoryl-undecaprenol N-acetylglucosamine transferase [Candidatus Omnitrophica bacterium]|nr:UDP-N-acetylglucosamine--N-acetylmuramyl-(pentapeptide) pyrophosphoryl-undecaprenol N-acetylglucosamine transferase [Candidatus Omnitrophota bacterium]
MKKTKKARVLVVSGASGGHIFPALALLEELAAEAGLECLLVLPEHSVVKPSMVSGRQVRYIPFFSASAGVTLKCFKLAQAFFKSAGIVFAFRPRVVVGFGSICCVPVFFWGKLLGAKAVIHEQNVLCGKANRLLGRFSDRIALSFEKTALSLGKDSSKAVVTGNPLRKGLLEKTTKDAALSFFGFSGDKFTLLVCGGSQGSRRINISALEALATYPDRSRVRCIHLSGKSDYNLVLEGYAAAKVEAKVFAFLDEMRYAYSCADLAICRAGATTIAELAQFGVPAVLIPYPHARRHQAENAAVLREQGAAVVLEDEEVSAALLQQVIIDFAGDPAKINTMRSGFRGFPTGNPAVNLASVVKKAIA